MMVDLNARIQLSDWEFGGFTLVLMFGRKLGTSEDDTFEKSREIQKHWCNFSVFTTTPPKTTLGRIYDENDGGKLGL